MNLNDYLSLTINEKFDYFMNTRFPTNRTPKYYVNWDKVIENTEKNEIALNTLNYLVGTTNIKSKAKNLFKDQPDLLKLVPVLLAARENKLDILSINNDLKYYSLDFNKIDLDRLDEYLQFMDDSGLFYVLEHNINSNLVDYVYGVEVGLDSNGRKNRSGTQNEKILEFNLQNTVKNTDLVFTTQATANYILKHWQIVVPEPLEDGVAGGRRYDGAIYNPNTKTVTVIETNYYGGGGSKLKAVCGEFSDIYTTSLKDAADVNFVWISDGKGWDTARNPLREAFDVIPNIFNLNMVRNGFLRDVALEKKRSWLPIFKKLNPAYI